MNLTGYMLDSMKLAIRTQNQVNEKVNKDWFRLGRPWYRAVNGEAGEAIGHLNWAWWSGGDGPLIPSLRVRYQLYLELADVLAFGLSLEIEQSVLFSPDEQDMVIGRMVKAYESAERMFGLPGMDLVESLEAVQRKALVDKEFDFCAYFLAAKHSGLDVSGALLFHAGKSVLNIFRQEHGYKEGKYTKKWLAPTYGDERVEDNVVLADHIVSYQNLLGDKVLPSLLTGEFERHLRTNLAMSYRWSQEALEG